MSGAQHWIVCALKMVAILLVIAFGIPLLIGGCLQLGIYLGI